VGCVIADLHRKLFPDRRSRVADFLHDDAKLIRADPQSMRPAFHFLRIGNMNLAGDRRFLFWSRYSCKLSAIKTTWSIEAKRAIISKKEIAQLRLGSVGVTATRHFSVSPAAHFLTCRAVGSSATPEAIDAPARLFGLRPPT
jgi:hypothetical protein